MKRPFLKPPLTIEQQTEHLIRKNMLISDRDYAAHCLSASGFYHLSAYWFPYKTGAGSFRPHTNFNEIIALYEFDRNLRLCILDAIERIEISVRTNFVNIISLKYGAHGYLNWDIYKNPAALAKIMRDIITELAQPNNQFMQHYKLTYTPLFPPLWIAAEIFSFGTISKLIASLKAFPDKNAIAISYSLFEEPFVTALHHLVYIRNICAHHGRLWNRELRFPLPVPQSQIASDLKAALTANHSKIYNSLCYINYLLRNIAPQLQWQNIITGLMDSHPAYAEMNLMGFPADWRQRPLWQ